MAELTVDYDKDITLTSTWTCSTTYKYTDYGDRLTSSTSQINHQYAEQTVKFTFNVPAGAKVIGVKVYASLITNGLYGGKWEMNGAEFKDGCAQLTNVDLSLGYLDVVFRWTAWRDSNTAHNDAFPDYSYYNKPSVTLTRNHESTSKIDSIYLMVEYEQRGIVYLAANNTLVPYQIYHAENGALVPYQLFKAEDNILIQY
jgi:hypothetical protein